MRMIFATIQPTKLSTVRHALSQVGVSSFSVCDAQGYARQRGQTALFRGNEYRVDLLRKVTLEIGVEEDQLETVIETIRSAARTGREGQIGDGKIFVMPMSNMIDIDPSPLSGEPTQ
jgi:nitrogen regulatory protein P-II 1